MRKDRAVEVIKHLVKIRGSEYQKNALGTIRKELEEISKTPDNTQSKPLPCECDCGSDEIIYYVNQKGYYCEGCGAEW